MIAPRCSTIVLGLLVAFFFFGIRWGSGAETPRPVSAPLMEEDWSSWEDYQKFRAEFANYWHPYRAGPNTAALFHFDRPESLDDLDRADAPATAGGPGPAVLIPGQEEEAASDSAALLPFRDLGRFGTRWLDAENLTLTEGYFGEGLRLTGEPLRLKAGDILFEEGRDDKHYPKMSIEFWIRVDALPEKEATLVRRDHDPNPKVQHNGLYLLLRPDGSLYYYSMDGHTRLPKEEEKNTHRFRNFREIDSEPGLIEPGRWHHIAVYSGSNKLGGYMNRDALWVDGRLIGWHPYGWPFTGERAAPTLIVGEGVTGALDQFRILKDTCRLYYPKPDDSFEDPAKTRSLVTEPVYVAPETDLLFRASFDDSLNADLSGGSRQPAPNEGGERFPRGVRGGALLLPSRARFGYEAEGNLRMDRGSVEFWVKPLGWAGDHRAQHTFLRITGRESWGLAVHIQNCGFMAPVTTFGGTGEGTGAKYVPFPPDTWTHLIQTWNGRDARLFVNGEPVLSHYAKTPFAEQVADPYRIYLSGGNPSLVDEVAIYRRDLTPEEVYNHYQRYLTKPELVRLPADPEVGYVNYADYPGVGKARLLPFLRIDEARIRWLSMDLRDSDGKSVTAMDIAYPGAPHLLLEGIPLRLPAGDYDLVVRLQDEHNQLLGETATRYHRPDFPWLGNTIGITDRVLKPFTPIEVEGETVKVVGRAHRLDGLGFYREIDDFGDALLAAPMRLEVVRDGGATPVAPSGSAEVVEARKHRAAWRGSGSGGGVRAETEVTLDYDGAAKMRLCYGPVGDEPVSIDGLRLVIPLKRGYDELYFLAGTMAHAAQFNLIPRVGVLPKREGVILDSREAYSREGEDFHPTVGSFIPELWIGNDERGLTFFGDSDAGWVPSDERASIEVVRTAEAAELRLHLVAEPFDLAETRELVFGLQATPTKPLPPDWRDYRLDVQYKLPSTFDLPDDWDPKPWGCFNIAPVDVGGKYDQPYDPEAVERSKAKCRENNQKAITHLDTGQYNWGYLRPDCPYPYFQQEWSTNFVAMSWVFTRSKIDWGVWCHKDWKDRHDIDGVYFDTGRIVPHYNVIAGNAYRLPDGRVQPGWAVWGQREYFKRSAHVFGDLGTECWTWGNGFYGTPMSAWQLGLVVGEQPPRNKTDLFFEQVSFPFDVHRVIAVSNKWGHIQLWQPPPDPYRPHDWPRKFVRSFYAQLCQLDTRTVFTGMELPFALVRFGIYRPTTRFHGFWKNDGFVDLREVTEEGATKPLDEERAEEILAGLYQQEDRFLLVLSNLGRANRWIETALRLDAVGIDAERPYTVWDTDEAELEQAFYFEKKGPSWGWVESLCWGRGGVALVDMVNDSEGETPDPSRKPGGLFGPKDGGKAATDEEILDELEAEEEKDPRRIELVTPAAGDYRFRCLVPFEDFRILEITPGKGGVRSLFAREE